MMHIVLVGPLRKRDTTKTLEDHHLFPRDWLHNNRDQAEEKQLWASLRDSVLNRIFVSKGTQRRRSHPTISVS
jgi:hypothetical protein